MVSDLVVATVVALAGRRIDAPGTEPPRFPLSSVPLVQDRIRTLFMDHQATDLVCAAACGADLLALAVAGELGIRRRIVLPFATDRFRQTSVVDRPGDWGMLFDRVITEVVAANDLVVLEEDETEDGYLATNLVILDQAILLARQDDPERESADDGAEGRGSILAVVVWDQRPRSTDDVTAAFAQEASERGLNVVEILTLNSSKRGQT